MLKIKTTMLLTIKIYRISHHPILMHAFNREGSLEVKDLSGLCRSQVQVFVFSLLLILLLGCNVEMLDIYPGILFIIIYQHYLHARAIPLVHLNTLEDCLTKKGVHIFSDQNKTHRHIHIHPKPHTCLSLRHL